MTARGRGTQFAGIRWASRPWQRVRRVRLSPLRVVAGGILVALVVTAAAGLLQLRTDTSYESFLPTGDDALELADESAASFGGDPVVVIAESAEDRELLTPEQLPKLVAMEGELSNVADVSVVYGPGTVLNQIAGAAQNMMATLFGQRDAIRNEAKQQALDRGLGEEEAAADAEAASARFDQRYGALLARGLPAGLPTLKNPGFVEQVIFGGENEEPKSQWSFVVPRQDAISLLVRPREGLDQAGTERLIERVREVVGEADLPTERVTVTGVPAVTAELGEQVRQELPLIGALAVGLIGVCYLFVPWLKGRRRGRLLPLTSTLCATALVLAGFGLLDRPLSLGVIAFLPILVGIASDYPAYLSHPGSRRRVVVVALASAAAFASLAISPLPFVRDLGLALAAGQLLALLLAIIFLRIRNRKSPAGLEGAEAASAPSEEDDTHTASADPGADETGLRQSAPQGQRRSPVSRAIALLIAAVVAASGWLALSQLDVESSPTELAAGSPAIEGAQVAEDLLGASGEIQVLVRGDNVLTPEALRWMNAAQNAIVVEHGRELQPILSPPSLLGFLGGDPSPEQLSAGMELMPEYLTRSVMRSDGERASMSFQLGLQDLDGQKKLIDEVRGTLPPPPEGIEADVVGLPVAAAESYEVVSGNRYLSNAVGLLGAGAVLLIGLPRRRDAFAEIFAAALATGWGLVSLWIFDVSLTPLTIVLGSLTTAIACGYTAMLRESARAGSWRLRRTVAVAALSATLGYLALTASGLVVIREFGLVLAGAVVLAFVASHVVMWLFPSRSGPNAGYSSSDVTPSSGTIRKEAMQ